MPSLLFTWLCGLTYEASLSFLVHSGSAPDHGKRSRRNAGSIARDVLPSSDLRTSQRLYCMYFECLACLADAARLSLQEFVPVARELEGNWTRFTPHYIVWVCPESYRASDECQSQCIHNGRYCTPDPDGDLEAGYSGRDIVQVRPAIRAKCLHIPFPVWLILKLGLWCCMEPCARLQFCDRAGWQGTQDKTSAGDMLTQGRGC